MNAPWQIIGGFRALVNPALDSPALRKALADIEALAAAPSASLLQAGRHRTILIALPGAAPDGAPIAAVAKFFGRQPLPKDLWDRLHATKARRTYEAALFLEKAGIGTTPPIACLERWRGPRLVASVFVSAYVSDATCFKDVLVALWQDHAPYAAFLAAIRPAADGIRALHDAGCAHGDLGNQNVFLTRRTSDAPFDGALFLDLNRSRFGSVQLPVAARARDLARVCLPEGFLDVFFRIYWRGAPPPAFVRFWRLHRKLFRIHSATRKFRHPLRELRYALHPETAPAQATYPPANLQWVWDADAMRPAPVAGEKTLLSFLEPGDRRRLVRESRRLRRRIMAASPCPGSRVPSSISRLTVAELDPAAAVASLAASGLRHALVRIPMAAPAATTVRRVAVANALAASGAGVAVQLLQVPDFFGGETFDAFAGRVLSALRFTPDWICAGQGVNALLWRTTDGFASAAPSACRANLRERPPLIPPAVEAPVLQTGCANIPGIFADGHDCPAVALAWRHGDGDPDAELRALRAIAAACGASPKLILISDSPLESDAIPGADEVAAPRLNNPENRTPHGSAN